ncbi:MAG: hypothetical protein QY323_04520 [Patescibacteria group bacterium]|nr:MAG: hypothetical protein QY323_04520 [Patescibacteria group bacterium]
MPHIAWLIAIGLIGGIALILILRGLSRRRARLHREREERFKSYERPLPNPFGFTSSSEEDDVVLLVKKKETP